MDEGGSGVGIVVSGRMHGGLLRRLKLVFQAVGARMRLFQLERDVGMARLQILIAENFLLKLPDSQLRLLRLSLELAAFLLVLFLLTNKPVIFFLACSELIAEKFSSMFKNLR